MLTRAVRFTTLAALAAPASALAGGFSLNEQSASAMGTANAGAAANPENATTVLFNPAGMSQLSGTNISFGAAVLVLMLRQKRVLKPGETSLDLHLLWPTVPGAAISQIQQSYPIFI
jgi:long-subunit fatty acid transport protein|tara:strand:- start:78 stop:428 length:351 start_codon:yes stop_codon:yes gene_type:complete